ncbi:MAG: hypothetical protein OSA97_07245 [Nevskia sp.]|nr:hypothetical protein [Nevskia sp.]
MIRIPALAVAAGVYAIAVTAPVQAHDAKDAKRTPAECETLPGDQKTGERAQCLACIERKEKHHYHSEYPPGNRCRPDDGKP